MVIESEPVILREYERIMQAVLGGNVYGQPIDTVERVVVAAYYLGKFGVPANVDHRWANDSFFIRQ